MRWSLRQFAMVLGVLVLAGSHAQAATPFPSRFRCPDLPAARPTPQSGAPVEVGSFPSSMVTHTTRQLATQTTSRISCGSYLETEWGAGPGQWGLCPDSPSTFVPGPPVRPAIDDHGDVFIFDKHNWRVLRYAAGGLVQTIPVSLPHDVGDECKFDFWRQLAISKDRLFIHSSAQKGNRIVDQINVLSLNGELERVIDLEPYYPMTAGGLKFENQPPLIPDRQRGVYLRLAPAGMVHYDADLRPEFKYLGIETALNEQLEVGWDGILYVYDSSTDLLHDFGLDNRLFMTGGSRRQVGPAVGKASSDAATRAHLLGTDVSGRFYFDIVEDGPRWLVLRISNSGGQATLADLPAEVSPPFELGPDGSLYSVSEDSPGSGSPAGPKIIRCAMVPG